MNVFRNNGMTLAEAIRLGAMMHEQAFGYLMRTLVDGEVNATCAIGAAVVAGFCTKDEMDGAIPSLTDSVYQMVKCPVCDVTSHVLAVIFHLNDYHKLRREAIADWVETITPKETTSPSVPSFTLA